MNTNKSTLMLTLSRMATVSRAALQPCPRLGVTPWPASPTSATPAQGTARWLHVQNRLMSIHSAPGVPHMWSRGNKLCADAPQHHVDRAAELCIGPVHQGTWR
jgi:hypothetical protein